MAFPRVYILKMTWGVKNMLSNATIELKLSELEKKANKSNDGIDLLLAEIQILKKKINNLSDAQESMSVELDALEKIVEERM